MRFVSTTVALSLLSSIVVLPGLAQANPTPANWTAQQVTTPQIDSFTVSSVDQLTPGTELIFVLQGTPNAEATLTIGNIATNLPMQEIEPGVYEGRYTIRSRDQISENTVVRANLQQNDQISSVRLQQPLVSSTTANGSSATQSQSLRIDRFSVEPVEQLDPGTELNFTLVGTPDASASFSIAGITTNQPMQEVSPGTYQGQYVIRRQDEFPDSGSNVTAKLQLGNRVVNAQLDQPLVAGTESYDNTSSLPLEIISPENNSRVSGTVEIAGRSAPDTTITVAVRAVNSLGGVVGLQRDILSESVQTDEQGDFSFTFNPTVAVPGTRYEISLNASKGNQTREENLVLIQE